jgi:DNA-binding NarL/FixJ family response regulator
MCRILPPYARPVTSGSVRLERKGHGEQPPGPFFRYNGGMSRAAPAVSIFVFAAYNLQRSAWTALLTQQPELKVAGAAATDSDLPVHFAAGGPGVILVDVALPQPELLTRLKKQSGGSELLVLVDSYEVDHVVSLLQAGAAGIMVRDGRVADLIRALVAVARGEMVLPAAVALEVITRLAQGRPAADSAVEKLSEREKEVVSLLAQGLTNKDIAQTLFLSVRTIEAHLRSIYGKLGVSSRTEAALWAVKSGFGTENK